MKALFKKMLAMFLMGIIFISTTGFGLIEHTCLMSGSKSASVLEKQGCCTKKKETASADGTIIKSGVCCESNAHVASIDLAPAVEKIANYFEKAFFTILETVVRLFTAALDSAEAILNSSDSSPPLAGKDIIIRHHSLLI